MHRTRSKRKQIIRATIVYTVMVTMIIIGLSIGVLYTMGYRLNTADRRIEQGGLLQVTSLPNGATVTLNQRQLSSTTPVRVDARAGLHNIEISRDGYRPWQKTITVDPGTVHWVSYARLLPLEPTERTMQSFEELSAVLPAANRDLILAQEDQRTGSFLLLDVSGAGDTVSSTELELPEAVIDDLPAPTEGSYEMLNWDDDERRVLLQYRAGQERQWLVLDTRSVENSFNVSQLLGGSDTVRQLMFDARDDRGIYALTGDVLRRIDISNRTLSAPLADNVEKFWQSREGVLSYVKEADAEGKREAGYITPGASSGRAIGNYEADSNQPVALVVGEYLNRSYAALQVGNFVEIKGIDLGSSDNDAPVRTERVTTMQLPESVRELSFSPDNRFVYVQYGATFGTYDIALRKTSTTTVQGDEPVRQPLGWLDDYHVYSDRGERLRWYEFDGENTQNITAIARGYAPKITSNDRFLYVVQPSDDTTSLDLVRVSLRTS